jgi:cytochrome c556
MMKSRVILVALASLPVLSSCQQSKKAEFLTMEQHQDRIAAMYAMRAVGEEFVAMFDEEKLGRKRMQQLSTLLVKQTDELPKHFSRQNAPNSDIADKARPEIWSQSQEFAAALAEMQTKSKRLKVKIDNTAEKDLETVWPVLVDTGNTCIACHVRFRVGGDPPHN